jgi:hypothetical protein
MWLGGLSYARRDERRCLSMPSSDEMFMANIECTMQDIRLKDELIAALERYNDLFVLGSKKRLKLVSEVA